jgi:hypothetical protein
MGYLTLRSVGRPIQKGGAAASFGDGDQENAKGTLWYSESNVVGNAIGYALHYSRSHDAVIRVYDALGNVTATHEHAGDFVEP